MAKPKVSREFRARLSEKLMEIGNLIIIALAIGQFVGNNTFSLVTFITGFVLSVLCYVISYLVSS